MSLNRTLLNGIDMKNMYLHIIYIYVCVYVSKPVVHSELIIVNHVLRYTAFEHIDIMRKENHIYKYIYIYFIYIPVQLEKVLYALNAEQHCSF